MTNLLQRIHIKTNGYLADAIRQLPLSFIGRTNLTPMAAFKYLSRCLILLAVSCGDNTSNNYYSAQDAACKLMPENGCHEFVSSLPVELKSDAEITKICEWNFATGCYKDGVVVIQNNIPEKYLCGIIAHEFLHALGDHYNGDSDHDHKKLPFNETYEACETVK